MWPGYNLVINSLYGLCTFGLVSEEVKLNLLSFWYLLAKCHRLLNLDDRRCQINEVFVLFDHILLFRRFFIGRDNELALNVQSLLCRCVVEVERIRGRRRIVDHLE